MMQDNIEIINLVPKFLDFYKKAKGCDCETRFELWKKHYGFAAVPPGEEGELLARQQFEAAWENYENVIPFLEQWSPDIQAIHQYLSKIKSKLAYEQSVDVALIFFVGAFDGNAFAAPYSKDRIARRDLSRGLFAKVYKKLQCGSYDASALFFQYWLIRFTVHE